MSGTLIAAVRQGRSDEDQANLQRYVDGQWRYFVLRETLQQSYNLVSVELMGGSPLGTYNIAAIEAAILELRELDDDKDRWDVLMQKLVDRAKLEGVVPAE